MVSWREVMGWGLGVVGITLAGFVYVENVKMGLRADAEKARQEEREKFVDSGAIVKEVIPDRELRRIVQETLRDELRDLQKAVPNSKPRTYAQIQSEPVKGEVRVERTPEPSPGCPLPAPVVESYPVEFMAKGKALTVQGPAGSEALVGKVELWQTKPGPLRLFGEAPFDADASKLLTVTPPPDPKFRAELRAGLDTDLNLVLGGTYYKGKKKAGFWGEIRMPLDSTDQSDKIIAGGLAFRLGG